jgi:hypothetical protein
LDEAGDPFDLKQLRAPANLQKLARAPSRNQRQQQFIKFPLIWLERLKTGRGVTYRLALHLLYQHWKTGGQPVRLSNVAVATAGVTRRSKWNALTELERAGLVRVEKRPRRSPVVTLLVD